MAPGALSMEHPARIVSGGKRRRHAIPATAARPSDADADMLFEAGCVTDAREQLRGCFGELCPRRRLAADRNPVGDP